MSSISTCLRFWESLILLAVVENGEKDKERKKESKACGGISTPRRANRASKVCEPMQRRNDRTRRLGEQSGKKKKKEVNRRRNLRSFGTDRASIGFISSAEVPHIGDFPPTGGKA